MRVAAFLFDLDGTLVDTEALWTKAIVDFVASRGGKTTYEDILPSVIGRNWLDIDRSLHERFPEIGESSPMHDAVELRAFYEVYATNPSSMRIEGSIAFFRAVSKIAPCAIVSGSPHDDVVAAAKLCGLEDCLSLVLGAGEYAEGKPSPSGFLKAAEILKAAPADCVVIEDSTVGVRAGVAAGMKVIALDRQLADDAIQVVNLLVVLLPGLALPLDLLLPREHDGRVVEELLAPSRNHARVQVVTGRDDAHAVVA